MIKKNKSIKIISPARLHFGFLNLGQNKKNSLGGIGLSINKFQTIIKVKKYHKLVVEGDVSNKGYGYVKNFCKKNKIKPNFLVNIEKLTPEHIGLGSGTQLALSIGMAINKLNNLNLSIIEIGRMLNRGIRSSVGLSNFVHGGFIIDLGIENNFFSNLSKINFPDKWKIILIIHERNKGIYGSKEIKAFTKLKKSTKNIFNLQSLVLKETYPYLVEKNFNAFSESITKIQGYMGKYFNKIQGGKYSSKIVSKVINFSKETKIKGYGQTSWGPTGFILLSNKENAQKIKYRLEKKFANCNDLKFIICSGKNTGATIKVNL